MKQLKYILTLIVGLIILSPGVKAETIIDVTYLDFVDLKDYQCSGISCTYLQNHYIYNNFNEFYQDSSNKQIFDTLYTDLINYYNTNFKDTYPYYTLSVSLLSNLNTNFDIAGVFLSLKLFSSIDNVDLSGNGMSLHSAYYDKTYYNAANSSTIPNLSSLGFTPFIQDNIGHIAYIPSLSYESNFNKTYSYSHTWNVYNSDTELLFTLTTGDTIQNLKDTINFDSNYTEVNLDDYHYVLLSLKDYSQTESFDTNLQVKGMIGITSIYDYGQVPKDNVLGSKIEDRCNVSYSDYTDYRLYVIDNDLKNRAVYAVKSCQDGSSFKFDSSIFNITYVTDDNVDDPIVVIDGIEYHTVPYDQLPSTATKNEEENYIPGQSEPLSFSQIIENITESLESIWNVITTFMGLVTKFFNTLPAEIRTISIATFSIACVLGIIKILKA